MSVDTRDPKAAEALVAACEGSVAVESHGQSVVVLNLDHWHDAAVQLRDAFEYALAVDITAVDHLLDHDRWIPQGIVATRFEIVANFLSLTRNTRIRLIAQIGEENPTVASIADVFPGLHNPEREIFDLLGVHFDGHTEMTRILMPDEWIGAPLRKDAPGARIPVTFKGDGGAR
ncbi:MAG: NADH-quinone oxidoreductase subunit C [Acidimicrobiia bacterium]